jgi:hypothetical protein
MRLTKRLREWVRGRFPAKGFYFDRPIVLFQSDDWGRMGVPDQGGFELLQQSGITLGERPYDFYSLETQEDLEALQTTLKKHQDSRGCFPPIEMNFIVANLSLDAMKKQGYERLEWFPLAKGLPAGWNRPNLIEAYQEGIKCRVFRPALHGFTHFCGVAVERNAKSDADRRSLLHKLWQAGTPYIHWRMPWIGYEYWDPEQAPDERFLTANRQRELLGQAVGEFTKLFSTLPRSVCAPGYRANGETHDLWAQYGIRVAQNGPGKLLPPWFDGNELLHLARNVEFEPAVDPSFSVESCLRQVENCVVRGLPAIVSVHSINFHSTLRDFRSVTLQALDEFLVALERKYANLLYLHDDDLYDIITGDTHERTNRGARVNVRQKRFSKATESRMQ